MTELYFVTHYLGAFYHFKVPFLAMKSPNWMK